jgi:hypothetical protein
MVVAPGNSNFDPVSHDEHRKLAGANRSFGLETVAEFPLINLA